MAWLYAYSLESAQKLRLGQVVQMVHILVKGTLTLTLTLYLPLLLLLLLILFLTLILNSIPTLFPIPFTHFYF
jgi:hypothetical protein